MSDIVWAVSPRRDRLSDLVQRMRQFAEDVLVACQVKLRFMATRTGRFGLELHRAQAELGALEVYPR